MKQSFLFFLIALIPLFVYSQNNELKKAGDYYQTARTALGNGVYEKARESAERALRLYESFLGPDSLQVGDACRLLGVIYMNQSKFDRSAQMFGRSCQVYRSLFGETHERMTTCYNNFGVLNERQGRFKQAAGYFKKTLDIRKKDPETSPSEIGKVCYNIGLTYLKMGELDSTGLYIRKALEIFDRTSHADEPFLTAYIASCHENLGEIARQYGNFPEALAHFSQALKLNEDSLGRQHPYTAYSYNNHGLLYLDKMDFVRAYDYFERSLLVRQQTLGADHPEVGVSYHNMANALNAQGKFQDAEKLYQEAARIWNKDLKSNLQFLTNQYLNLGSLYYQKGDWNMALENHQKALALYRQVYESDNAEVAECLAALAMDYLELGNYQLALEKQKEAVEILTRFRLKRDPLIARIYREMAVVYSKMDDQQKAASHFLKSYQQLNFSKGDVDLLENVSSHAELLKTLVAEAGYFNEYYRGETGHTYLMQAHDNYSFALDLIDWIRRSIPRTESKLELNDSAFDIYEAALRTAYTCYENLKEDAYLEAIVSIIERSNNFTLLETLKQSDAFLISGIPPELVAKDEELKWKIAEVEQEVYEFSRKPEMASQVVDSLKNVRLSLRQKWENLLDTIESDYPVFYQIKYNTKTLGLTDIQAELLSGDEGLLYYFVGEQDIYIVLIEKNAVRIKKQKKDFNLKKQVLALTKGIAAFGTSGHTSIDALHSFGERYARSAHQLYQVLIASLDGPLPERLILVPNGVLGYLPFEILLTKPPAEAWRFANHEYLLKHHAISYTYSATLLQEMRNKEHEKVSGGFLGFAPFFSGDTSLLVSRNISAADRRMALSPLPYTREEVLGIQHIFGGQVVLDEAATESSFYELASGHRIIHLATHGKANAIGDYSFLAFTEIPDSLENEWLYTREIYNLRLNADLVVLSACETGVGELKRGEGIISLARGFTAAGAKSLVTSLWNVNDNSTQKLMVSFYTYLNQGYPKDEALQKAKLDFLKNRNSLEAHPYFWAAFIPIGDMAPVVQRSIWVKWWPGLLLLAVLGLGGGYFRFFR